MAKGEMTKRIVVVGGSAGSLEIILTLLPWLPAGADTCYLFVIHRKNEPDSILQELFTSRTSMQVREVEDKERLLPDTIYIAPPDYLLLEDKNGFSLDCSERVHYSRPSIDVTFESAAKVFQEKCIGILLSGANADGAAGLETIKAYGGLTIVQSPLSAEVAFMPQQAINSFTVDHIIDANEMGPLLNKLLADRF
jgi:two-component system chemotaxis response regulator CheB